MLRSPMPIVLVMNPNVPALEMSAPGFPKFGWLSAFSASTRSCSWALRGIAIVLKRPKSTFQKPGPWIGFRGDVPEALLLARGDVDRGERGPVEVLVAVGVRAAPPVDGASSGCQGRSPPSALTRSGYCPLPAAFRLPAVPWTMLIGLPLMMDMIPFNCQPPNIAFGETALGPALVLAEGQVVDPVGLQVVVPVEAGGTLVVLLLGQIRDPRVGVVVRVVRRSSRACTRRRAARSFRAPGARPGARCSGRPRRA